MKYFDQIYSKVFGRDNTRPVAMDALIKRSRSFLEKFNKWKNSDLCQDFLNDVWQSYFWSKKGIEKKPTVLIHESNYSNGFAINYEDSYDKNYFHFLFDYLADQVKHLGYILVTSKVTMTERGDNVETREMHYLKPKRSFIEPIDQKYGNVQIEYLKINEYPTRIKLVANVYPDRKYKEPEDFELLAKFLFTK